MVAPTSSRLTRLREEHSAKALRYCAVSVVNVTTGMTTLAVCHAVFGWPAVASNITAWMVSTIPAYLLSRAWVWKRDGTHDMGREVLPFWVLAFVGLVFSSIVVALVEQQTERTTFILIANLAAYGIVWMAKYVFLDKVMWRHQPSAQPVDSA